MTADEIKKYKLGGIGSTHGRTERYIYCSVEKNGRKRLLGRPKRRWKRLFLCLKR
jgi:hypothetical protein